MTYFVTFCVRERRPVLACSEVFEAFEAAVKRLTTWTVAAAVIMPDHVHLLARPIGDREAPIGNLSGALKRWTRQPFPDRWEWQTGSFDRLLRSDESVPEKWAYIRENPVRAQLVKKWQDWPYRIGFDQTE